MFDRIVNTRSSRSQMFLKISVLINFANFTGIHLCWSLFLIKSQAETTLALKKDTQSGTGVLLKVL